MKKLIFIIIISGLAMLLGCLPGDELQPLYTNDIYANDRDNLGSEEYPFGAGWFLDTYSYNGTDFVNLELGQGVKVYNSTNQDIPNNTMTTISWDSEVYDYDEIHDCVSNNSRLYCNTTGIYILIANLEFQVSAIGYRHVRFFKNGDSILGAITYYPVNEDMGICLEAIDRFEANEYVEVRVVQTSGSTLSLHMGSPDGRYFAMQRVGY